MTEQQIAIKSLRKQLFSGIGDCLDFLEPEQKKQLKEFLELNVDFKKNKVTISFPYSYVKVLERSKTET